MEVRTFSGPFMSVTSASPWRPVSSTKTVGVDGPPCLPWAEGFMGGGPSPGGPRAAPAHLGLPLFPQIGLFDLEVNCLTKILFGALVVVSLVMVALQHFAGRWYLQIIRFLLLFSNIIPIR